MSNGGVSERLRGLDGRGLYYGEGRKEEEFKPLSVLTGERSRATYVIPPEPFAATAWKMD